MTFLAPCLPRNRPARQTNIAGHVSAMPTPADMTRNLRAVFESATADELAAGTGWYGPVSHVVLYDIGAAAADGGFNITDRQAAGILAALSPGTDWSINIAAAIHVAETGTGHSHQSDDNNRKALAILHGADPSDVLGGRKVRSFFANLETPSRQGAVTIDRHALSILFGKPLSERQLRVLGKHGVYTYAAAIYRAVARDLGIAPHVLQAIVWVRWRNLKDSSEPF